MMGVAKRVRYPIEVGGERIWRLTDFENLSPLHMLSFRGRNLRWSGLIRE